MAETNKLKILYVLDIMRNAGVDLSTPQPIADALDTFGKVVAELNEMAVL